MGVPERPAAGLPLCARPVHVNGTLADFATERLASRPLPRLHLATGRVGLELVVRHLIAEWGVQPKSDDWPDILEASLAGFEQRRTAT